MHISWLGSTAVKIQAKPNTEDVTILIDPYKQKEGSFPKTLAAEIVLYSQGEDGSITISGKPFIVSSPGEIETKNVLITAVSGHSENQTMFRLDVEDVSMGFLGRAKESLTDSQLEALSGVDVLFVPIGGGDVYDGEEAVTAINSIEPRVVIPVAFQSDNEPNAADVGKFLKGLGVANKEPEKKIILKKKDLPQEDLAVYVLAKE